MSDLMLLGALCAPYDPEHMGFLEKVQLIDRAKQAAERIQADEQTIKDLRAQLSAFRTQTAQDIKNFMSEIRELKAERDELAKAADALCKRMRVIHDDPLYQSIWACALNHGVSYATGPTYTEELKALESVLRGGE